MLLAEKAEPRPLRPVLAAGVSAAHVPLEAAGFPRYPVALPRARCGQCGGDMFGEKLGEMVNENIEWMRGASGHTAALTRRRDIAQLGLRSDALLFCFIGQLQDVLDLGPFLRRWSAAYHEPSRKKRLAWFQLAFLLAQALRRQCAGASPPTRGQMFIHSA